MATSRTEVIGVTARQLGLVSCDACRAVYSNRNTQCDRCGARLQSRKHLSLQRTWAFLLIGVCTYIPANTLPIMHTDSLGETTTNTIISGVFALLDYGSVFVAAVVFIASVVIPVLKFIIVGGLALSLQLGWQWSGPPNA